MAIRPVFVPDPDHPQLVHAHEVDFHWRPGRSPEHLKANIAKLHAAALHRKVEVEIDCRPRARTLCHARSCALYVALVGKKLLDEVVGNQDLFIETLIKDSFY